MMVMSTAPFPAAVALRYKKHLVYCEKTGPMETMNGLLQRAWFIMKNIAKMPYATLAIYSKYYQNVHHKGMQYDIDIHETLGKFDSVSMASSNDQS